MNRPSPKRRADRFDWDDDKAAANLAKHGVRFDEAQGVFGDPRALTIYDEKHSQKQDRFVTIGLSKRGKLLVVVYTDRAGEIRIIGARNATTSEVATYVQRD